MGPLVAVGGFFVPGEVLRDLERGLNNLCQEFGFPQGEEFKWSPGRLLWMHDHLVGDARAAFFAEVLRLAAATRVKALVVIDDTTHDHAIRESPDHEMDVVAMFLERANGELARRRRHGLVFADRPTGGRTDEARFLSRCMEALQRGTKFVQYDRIAMNVMTTESHLVRLLQLADLIVSCSVSFVSGEDRYSPLIFEHIRPLLCRGWVGCGGIGFKIHPDHNYVNLYHWLLGDLEFLKRNVVFGLPIESRPYAKSANQWR
jgi:hypothetical protein